jgi:hypothetical protein
MTALLWILLPLVVAAGSALLSFYIMQAKLEVAVAKERESMAEVSAALKHAEKMTEERVRAAEESTLRRAFDQFLADFRVEERHYMRENKTVFANRKSLILQERLYFRTVPLSNWIEHEMVVEEGSDAKAIASQASVFSTRSLSIDEVRQNAKLLKGGQPQAARTA